MMADLFLKSEPKIEFNGKNCVLLSPYHPSIFAFYFHWILFNKATPLDIGVVVVGAAFFITHIIVFIHK
jgi:hypothetical protein